MNVFFTWTVVYALVSAPDFDALTRDLAPWMTVSGAVMVIAGWVFAIEVLRAGVMAPRVPVTFMWGVVTVAVASGLSEPVQVAAAAVRDLGVAAMRVAVAGPASRGLRRGRPAAVPGRRTIRVSGPRPTPVRLIGELRHD